MGLTMATYCSMFILLIYQVIQRSQCVGKNEKTPTVKQDARGICKPTQIFYYPVLIKQLVFSVLTVFYGQIFWVQKRSTNETSFLYFKLNQIISMLFNKCQHFDDLLDRKGFLCPQGCQLIFQKYVQCTHICLLCSDINKLVITNYELNEKCQVSLKLL